MTVTLVAVTLMTVTLVAVMLVTVTLVAPTCGVYVLDFIIVN